MIQDNVSPQLKEYWSHRRSVPGHMYDMDFLLFDEILKTQTQACVTGDLLEIGAYMGKSAIVVGSHLGAGESFFVCDVFDSPIAGDSSNTEENQSSYDGLTRLAFEKNYRRFLSTDATIIQELSKNIAKYVTDASVRFAHIDGGHLYETVKQDICNARRYMKPDGIVAFDDFRSHHAPGVAAAIWGEVATSGLLPICTSEGKLYASWSPETAVSMAEHVASWLGQHPEVHYGIQTIEERPIVVVSNPPISTSRGRVKAFLPQIVIDMIQPSARPYLGE